MDLQLTNVINVSVSAAQAGIGEYNTSNLALFTSEEHEASFGDDGYKIYLEPSEVATDFGTESMCYAMALSVFSQKPNILAGNGYLVIIPILETVAEVIEVQTLTATAEPTSGSFVLSYDGNPTTALDFDDDAAAIQVALRLVAGLGAVTVTGDLVAGLVVTFAGVEGPAELLVVEENSLQDADDFNVFIAVEVTTAGVAPTAQETIGAAISRSSSLVQYFGILPTAIISEADIVEAAAIVQTLNKIAGWPQRAEAAVNAGGVLDDLRAAGQKQNRGLFYGSDNDEDCLKYAAAYMGRALSVNFNGSNTTITMHLKDLIGILADPSMTQTLLAKCQAAGADVYVSLQGVAKVFCSGENSFFDQVYNVQWFVGQIQVAGFNSLAQTSTKLPQTEQGLSVLKGAYRNVCEQAIVNQYGAPGTWTDPTTFGNQADFFRNISERGYYIYSAPVATQSASQRAARNAPLIQIALKEAGAMHKSSVIIYVNA